MCTDVDILFIVGIRATGSLPFNPERPFLVLHPLSSAPAAREREEGDFLLFATSQPVHQARQYARARVRSHDDGKNGFTFLFLAVASSLTRQPQAGVPSAGGVLSLGDPDPSKGSGVHCLAMHRYPDNYATTVYSIACYLSGTFSSR